VDPSPNIDAAEGLIRRLLGPSGPEVSCEGCFEQLDEYVDAELTGRPAGPQTAELAAHLEGCPACREDYESLRAFLAQR
jgi:hypothetical protein